MRFKLRLDCDARDDAEILRHQGAVLAALQLHESYIAARNILIGTGPELYAEQHMKSFFVDSNGEFNDLVLIYFVKILQAHQNG